MDEATPLFKQSKIANLLCKIAFVFALTSVITLPITNAATQGTTGTSSSGNVELNIVVGQLALIFGLDDINLGAWSGAGSMQQSDPICVARNGFVGQTLAYRILATGDGSPSDISAFTLTNTIDQIEYEVRLTDDFGVVRNLPPGQIVGGHQFFADNGLRFRIITGNCFAPDATLTVEVPESQLQQGSGGTYSGTLTLTLIPE